jgi:hypothetical protein
MNMMMLGFGGHLPTYQPIIDLSGAIFHPYFVDPLSYLLIAFPLV